MDGKLVDPYEPQHRILALHGTCVLRTAYNSPNGLTLIGLVILHVSIRVPWYPLANSLAGRYNIPEYVPARVPEDVLSCTVGVVSHEHAMGGQRARMAGARPRGGAATLLYAPEVVMIELPLAALLARQRARAALTRPRVATLGARQTGRGGIAVLVSAPGACAWGGPRV